MKKWIIFWGLLLILCGHVEVALAEDAELLLEEVAETVTLETQESREAAETVAPETQESREAAEMAAPETQESRPDSLNEEVILGEEMPVEVPTDGEGILDGAEAETVPAPESSGMEDWIDFKQDETQALRTDTEPSSEMEDGMLVLSVEVLEEEQTEALAGEMLCSVIPGGQGTLARSGRAKDASGMRLWGSADSFAFTGMYGDQLSGNARTIYEKMKKKFLEAGSISSFTVALSEPFYFDVQIMNSGKGGADAELEGNETYRNKIVRALTACSQAAYDAFIYDYPEVFWLGTVSYRWDVALNGKDGEENGRGSIDAITFTPSESYEGAWSERSAYNQKTAAVVQTLSAGFPAGATREEMARQFHHYLCETLVYETTDHAWSAGGAFLYGNVVCEGYAKAYHVLCRQFGIPCILVPGLASSPDGGGEAHMWNYVQMENGLWYLVDVTWDDQDSGEEYSYFLRGSRGYGFITTENGYSTSMTIGQERIVYSNFSSIPESMSFRLPDLASDDYVQGVEPHTHEWEIAERTDPTCEENGVVRYVCKTCEAEKKECLVRLGHSFGVYKVNSNATCTKNATKTAYCIRCGIASSTLPVPGSRLNHSWKYESNHDATVFSDGTRTGTCARCGSRIVIKEEGSRLSPRMKLNVTSLRLKKGQSTSAVRVSGLAKGDYVENWKSSNTAIVKVPKQGGKITAGKKVGKAVITIRLASGYSRKIQVAVQSGTVKTKCLEVPEKSLVMKKGTKKKLKTEVYPLTSQEKVTFTSSNKKLATVSGRGVIKALRKGSARITVKSGKKTVTVKLKITG